MLPGFTGAALKVTGIPVHTVVVAVDMVTDGEPDGSTVMVIALLVSVTGGVQLGLVMSTQVTWSLLFKEVVVKVLPVPAFTPFTFHCSTGESPWLVTTAVKVTGLPEQMEVVLAEMVTTGDANFAIKKS